MAKKKGGRGMRTKGGGVSATARKKSGATKKSPLKTGSFPVFDHKSAMSAIKLRGHSPSKAAVLNKVSRWASAHKDTGVKNAVKAARSRDRGK